MICVRSETLATRARSEGRRFPCVCFPIGNILLSKPLWMFFSSFKKSNYVLEIQSSFLFYVWDFWFCRFFKFINVIFKNFLFFKWIIYCQNIAKNITSKRSYCFKTLKIICFILSLIAWFVNQITSIDFLLYHFNSNFRFRACFEQVVPWHSSNYRVRIHSKTRTWHYKNIQSNAPYR